jgi:hypothetical protein
VFGGASNVIFWALGNNAYRVVKVITMGEGNISMQENQLGWAKRLRKLINRAASIETT